MADAYLYVYGDAVKLSASTITGLGPWYWAVPIPPESGASVTAWLGRVPVDDRRRPISAIRVGSALVRRRDRSGADYFVLARPLRPPTDRLYPLVVADSLNVSQVMPRWSRAYAFVFVFVFYALGFGGVVAAIAGDPGALLLLIFPAVLRLFIVPMVRRQDRDAARTYFTEQTSNLVVKR